MISHVDEQYPSGLPLEEVPVYIARNKALAVAATLPDPEGNILVAADTIVVLDGQVIGKPADADEAVGILGSLSGRVHRVITGVVILNGGQETAFSDITEVEFHPLTEEQIRFYVERYAPYDKAGAYAIQEWIGVVGIKAIRGDFYNVMGLPVSRVVQALEEFR